MVAGSCLSRALLRDDQDGASTQSFGALMSTGWLKSSSVADIVIGIVGSILGHFLFGLLGIAAFGAIGRLIISVIGAMLLIALLRRLR